MVYSDQYTSICPSLFNNYSRTKVHPLFTYLPSLSSPILTIYFSSPTLPLILHHFLLTSHHISSNSPNSFNPLTFNLTPSTNHSSNSEKQHIKRRASCLDPFHISIGLSREFEETRRTSKPESFEMKGFKTVIAEASISGSMHIDEVVSWIYFILRVVESPRRLSTLWDYIPKLISIYSPINLAREITDPSFMSTLSMTARIHTMLMSPCSLDSLAPSPTFIAISSPLLSHLFPTYRTMNILNIKDPVAWLVRISDAAENGVVFGFIFDLTGAFGSVDVDMHLFWRSLEKIVYD